MSHFKFIGNIGDLVSGLPDEEAMEIISFIDNVNLFEKTDDIDLVNQHRGYTEIFFKLNDNYHFFLVRESEVEEIAVK